MEEEVPRREFLRSVKKIDWPGHGANPRCVRVEDPKGRFMNICHPDISDVVIDKAKFNLAELHRLPGHQEISVDFEGPCEVRDRILRCPPSAKASWEIEAEKKEPPPRGTGLETGKAGERRAGKPRTEEERRLRHWGSE